MTTKFKPNDFESKWQKEWESMAIYSPDLKSAKNPYYNLMMFPYPSAEGLHIGNMYAFTGVDVHGRFMRMRGFDVFEPFGLDGFGIHSENYAIKINKHPMEQAKISETNFYRQLRIIGPGIDWNSLLETYDPDYYRWTQWIFVQMFKHGLSYRAKAKVNWCPSCKTVLADEQVLQKSQIPASPAGRPDPKSQINSNDQNSNNKDEVCERCNTPVEKRDLEQWFFKITSYADKLLQNTYKDQFIWSNKVKIGQQKWIGKKEGIEISYQLSDNSSQSIKVFTTTPVNFGMTFLVVSPEHELVKQILDRTIYIDIDKYNKVIDYVKRSIRKTKEERQREAREKSGVFTGLYIINPVNNKEVPVWISDFVVSGFGTGAVQGCPGHDVKDFEFAKKYKLPIIRVVMGTDKDISEIDTVDKVIESGMPGKMINSSFLNGLEFKDAMQKTMDYFEEKGWGKRVTTYHLRDWLISRQRYWGAPIPMIYCPSCKDKGMGWLNSNKNNRDLENSNNQVPSTKQIQNTNNQDSNNVGIWSLEFGNSMLGWFPVPEDQLPVLLPDIANWRPVGEGTGPLSNVPEFYNTKCPNCGGDARRETDIIDTFVDSAWYYLRYPSVGNQKSKIKNQNNNTVIASEARQSSYSNEKIATPSSDWVRNDDEELLPWNSEITRRWLPVDSYIGGAEHTVLHLLYTRFVYMALIDWGLLKVKQPVNSEFIANEPFKRFYAHGLIIKDGAKMSKSKGNIVIPDEYIKLYGADTLRTYLMFIGPFDSGGDFRDTGILGMHKWLSRVWRLCDDIANKTTKNIKIDDPEALKKINFTIKFVTIELQNLRYNTAIAKLMEFTNWWMEHLDQVDHKISNQFIKLLAPFAPHMTEEIFQTMSRQTSVISHQTDFKSIHQSKWPEYDEKYLVEENITIIIQINGKMRDKIVVSARSANTQSLVEQMARESANTKKWLSDKTIKKVIFIPKKLINFVI